VITKSKSVILADCTNGHASATMLRPSLVCLLFVMYVLWLNNAT